MPFLDLIIAFFIFSIVGIDAANFSYSADVCYFLHNVSVYYFIDKPELTVIPPLSQTVNESVNIRLQCNATGVPVPLMLWTKDDLRSSTVLHRGEILWLYNVGYRQKGTYYCTASNKIGNATASSVLLVNRKLFTLCSKWPILMNVSLEYENNSPAVDIFYVKSAEH